MSNVAFSFEWDPITDDDWNFALPDSIRIRYAAILFEKIYVDDTKLSKGVSTYSIYKRIRIFEDEGRALADVQIPLILSYDSDIEELEGRVILKNGTIVELNSDHIFSKYIYESEEEEVEQTFFYLPGVTSDCIIEYYIECELSFTPPIWDYQKDLYLKYGELTWDFYKGDDTSQLAYYLFRAMIYPNFVIINNVEALKYEEIMNDDSIDKIVFRTENVTPFEDENYIISSEALKAQLVYFYTEGSLSAEYWVNLSKKLKRELLKDELSKSILSEIKNLAPSTTDKQKIVEFTYKWVTDNIKNVETTGSDEEFFIGENLDSVVTSGYGSAEQINRLFVYILNELGVNAYLVHCLSRNENLFRSAAKYWQFDHQITAVRVSFNKFDFYDPSDKNIPGGSVDYQYEDTYGFIVGNLPKTEIYIPASGYNINNLIFYDNLIVENDFSIKSSFTKKYKGHFAYDINNTINELTKNNSGLARIFDDDLSIKAIDTVYCNEQNTSCISLEGKAELQDQIFDSGNFFVMSPFNNVAVLENINVYEKRVNPIQFDFPYKQQHVLQIYLPANIYLYKYPKELFFSNDIGECAASFSQVNDQQLSVVYVFTLKRACLSKDKYPELVELFKARKSILSKVILLVKK